MAEDSSECADRRAVSVSLMDCIDRGLRRNRGKPLAIRGAPRSDGNGLDAEFSLQVKEGQIEGVSFRVSTCTALVAYAELLAEWVTGLTLRDAIRRARAEDLVRALPSVPAIKRDRALLAVAAFTSSVVTAVKGETQ